MLDFVDKPLRLEGEPKFRIISTFSGAGGSSLGYIWSGGKVLAAIEWDDNAVATYRLNFPDTPILHLDIKTVTVEEVLALTGLHPGELDILDGSPPCQGFSSAGKRQFDDPRNSLFKEFVRLLRGLQPKCFVMENVSGMVKGDMKHIFVIVMRELKASGYQVKCQLMNAMYFGVPQSRERVIFIGVRNDLCEDLGIKPSHPKSQTIPITVKQAIGADASYHNSSYTWTLKYNTPMATLTKTRSKSHCIKVGGNIRYLTEDELKAIGSYPFSFRFLSYEDAIARIGNSVPPRFMEAIASHIYENILKKVSDIPA